MNNLIILIAALALAACGTLQPVDVGAVVRDAVTAADRNSDGLLTNREVKDAKNDPNFWLTVGAGLLGILGLAKGQSAERLARKVEVETDEQWDALNKKA